MKLLSPAATVLAPLLLLLLLLLLPLPSAQAAAAAEWEAVVGGVRVQALSPTLLRVEPIGPHGYENRTTFMVANRSSSNTAGLALRPGATPLELHTSHYTVRLRTGENATVIQAGTCEEPQRGVAAVDSVHDYAHRDDSGILVANRSACCAACDGSVTCLAWQYSEKVVPATPPGGKCEVAMHTTCGAVQKNATACLACVTSHASELKANLCSTAAAEAFCGGPSGSNCWPMISFASTEPKPGYELGFKNTSRFSRPNFVVRFSSFPPLTRHRQLTVPFLAWQPAWPSVIVEADHIAAIELTCIDRSIGRSVVCLSD